MDNSVLQASESVAHRGTVAIRTHGCKLNQADSDLLARRFADAGYRLVDSAADADVFVLNTCTVTATADAKARQALRAARRANPKALIVAAGCYPQRAAAELAQLEAVSLVVGNSQKDQLVPMVLAALGEKTTSHQPPAVSVQPARGFPATDAGATSARGGSSLPIWSAMGRSRAMVKIQDRKSVV